MEPPWKRGRPWNPRGTPVEPPWNPVEAPWKPRGSPVEAVEPPWNPRGSPVEAVEPPWNPRGTPVEPPWNPRTPVEPPWNPRGSRCRRRRYRYCPGTTKQKYYQLVGLVLCLSLFSNYQLQEPPSEPCGSRMEAVRKPVEAAAADAVTTTAARTSSLITTSADAVSTDSRGHELIPCCIERQNPSHQSGLTSRGTFARTPSPADQVGGRGVERLG